MPGPPAVLAGRTDPDPAELHRLAPTARTQTVHEAGPWFPTCNIAYPRALLERLGGFDLRYGWGGEDTDLAWRAQAVGAPVAYVEGARVLHAVEDLGTLGALRLAGRWSEAMRVFAAHPQMRRQALHHGVFWRQAHRDLLLAAAGLALAPRRPPAVALTLPWLHGARRRTVADRRVGPPPAAAAGRRRRRGGGGGPRWRTLPRGRWSEKSCEGRRSAGASYATGRVERLRADTGGSGTDLVRAT